MHQEIIDVFFLVVDEEVLISLIWEKFIYR